MHRIDTPTAQKDKFGAGKNGFTGGNPQTGELPTALDADFFDSVQEEIASVIEAGGIALSKASNAQLLAAMKNIVGPGRLLNVQVFIANGTVTKTAGAKKWRIRVLGGGGGSSAAPATSTGQVSVSNGGGAGAYAEGIYDVSGISTAAVTVGSGGVGGTSSSQYGADGSATSVGSLISAPGGKAGLPAGPANPPFQPVANNNGASPTGWNIVGTSGPGAEAAVAVSANYAAGSRGANSPLGVGGSIPAINNNASTGGGFGSGASGCANGPSQAINAGAAGRPGVAIIEEYA
ncbi:hypothetical protein [Pantoea septica]|uniref:glycine-rich domain-containing protein n=1 Tax=Pantoea septica TaxID=472695 RepID=UPI002FDB214B